MSFMTPTPSLDQLSVALVHEIERHGRPERVVCSGEYLSLLLHEASSAHFRAERGQPFYVEGVPVVEDPACRPGRIHFQRAGVVEDA